MLQTTKHSKECTGFAFISNLSMEVLTPTRPVTTRVVFGRPVRNKEKSGPRRNAFCLIACLVLVTRILTSAQDAKATATTMPRVEGETLSGKKILLPDDARGKIALLAIGFSRKGGNATRAWSDRFKKEFGADPRFAVYPVAELEGAPRFVRGMIVGSMRKGTPTADRDRFVTLFQGTEELKRFVGFSTSDEAYLLLLDANGTVQWRGHGLFGEEDYPALQTTARKLAAQ